MRTLLILLPCFGQTIAQVQQSLAAFSPNVRTDHRKAITPDIRQFAEDVLRNGSVPGAAIGVVWPDRPVELTTFGIKSEDGTNMTTDVSTNMNTVLMHSGCHSKIFSH